MNEFIDAFLHFLLLKRSKPKTTKTFFNQNSLNQTIFESTCAYVQVFFSFFCEKMLSLLILKLSFHIEFFPITTLNLLPFPRF